MSHSSQSPVKAGLLDTIGNTPLVSLPTLSPKPGVQIFAKLEGQNPTGSVKDRIAKSMIDAAERDGLLTREKTILEPSSGNTGISLALVCKLKGYKLKVVMPANVSLERVQLLKAYGAQVELSDGQQGTNHSIRVAEGMVSAEPGKYFMPYQYGNPANPQVHYETTGLEIIEALPTTDVFVAGLGTGGTLMGVARRLKEHNPSARVVAVAPHPDDVIQGLRSLEEGFIPPILDLSMLDGRIMIDSEEAFQTTRRLMEQEGLFTGISAGAVIACALQLARRMEKGNIVCLLADGGWKYLSTDLWTQDYRDLEGKVKGKIWW
ncbi:MAG: cysteine synthase family protein [SAR202 cluster bacterium]|nr:cysteine synthase family protein [SAR202 cluster bacterium]